MWPSLAAAQSTATGSLTGTVADPSGAVLPGVTVVAVNPDTGVSQSTVTGSSGEWTVASLPVGRYELTFELSGFKKLTRSDVQVEAVVTRQLNVTLDVGAMTDQMTVSADAPLVVANTSATYRRLNAEELTLVPTSTRSFTHLLSAEAGVSADLPPVLINGTGNISPSVNGTRTTSTSLFFNGIDATNITSNEGSMTDNISPAPGDARRGQTSDEPLRCLDGPFRRRQLPAHHAQRHEHLSRRRSSNLQHENFNANDFFYEKDGIDKPKARRNEGGFTIGGPLRRNKLFFFGGYQRTDAETGFVPTASSLTVLPAALRLINGARTKENLLAAFCRAEPRHLGVDSQGAVRERNGHGVHLRRRRGALQPAESQTGDFVIPAPREGIGDGRERRRGDGIGRRQPARASEQRGSSGVQAGSGHAEAGRATVQQSAAEWDVLLRRFPRLRSVPRSRRRWLRRSRSARRQERHVRAHRTTGCSAATRSMRSAVVCSACATRGSWTTRSTSLTNASVGVPNPATFFDDVDRHAAARPLHRQAGDDHGAFLVWRSQRLVQQAAPATWTIGTR